MPICRSCNHDAGNFGTDPNARHACSFDPKDQKIRSINWEEHPEAFVITHANGVLLPKSERPVTQRGYETQFNSFLLRCPRLRVETHRKVDMSEMMAEARLRGRKILENERRNGRHG